MDCSSCGGTGESAKPDRPCFLCEGSGALCDTCGESCIPGVSPAPGEIYCDSCGAIEMSYLQVLDDDAAGEKGGV